MKLKIEVVVDAGGLAEQFDPKERILKHDRAEVIAAVAVAEQFDPKERILKLAPNPLDTNLNPG